MVRVNGLSDRSGAETMNDKKDVAAVELTPMQLISQVVENPDFDVDKLEKMMQLQERWEDRQAEKDFNTAVAAFQADVPSITKDKKGVHDIKYAPLDSILQAIQPLLTAQGLSVRFSTTMSDAGMLHATCTISHVSGHSEVSEITVPLDRDMRANASQQMGSANSYAKRYALGNALNLSFVETDTDATDLHDVITTDQVTVINDLIAETGASTKKILDWAGVASVEDIPAGYYDETVRILEAKRGKD